MAIVHPFRPYRYTSKAGDPQKLLTQPYDKISPEMQQKYMAASPYNLVHAILGERKPSDNGTENVYTRAAAKLNEWILASVLAQDPEPAFYAYYQEFTDPDTGETLVRKGLLGLGEVSDYSAGVVHRHEQTLSGPKKDRTELLRHTQVHWEPIFLLYPDPECRVDAILDAAASKAPIAEVTDDYGALHKLWRISDAEAVAKISALMSDKKLIIADGHHRYETAVAYSKEAPKADAKRMMMTFVNMHSPGLRILATHRLVSGLEGFDEAKLIEGLAALGSVRKSASDDDVKGAVAGAPAGKIVMGIVTAGGSWIFETKRAELDVTFLHSKILEGVLGITEEAVRDERHLKYVRGFDPAIELVRSGKAQVGFLLHPTTMQQVADISFGGGVMPQKSTDFYPKLLSGLAIYRLEK
jgi:uncharacterized protein (DUF1015 family)